MGWKAVKKHYNIGHNVAFFEGEGLCIGSGYIHGIIMIDPASREITTCRSSRPGHFSNDDCQRYWDEIHSDLGKLWELIAQPDVFSQNRPVFTYKGGDVIECQCEEYGWPNVTHDGQMMYDNIFFENEVDARAAGIRNAKAGIKSMERVVAQSEKELEERRGYLAEHRSDLAKLLPAA